MLRKLGVMLSAVCLVSAGVMTQAWCCLAVIAVAMLLHLRFRPYAHWLVDHLETASLSTCFFFWLWIQGLFLSTTLCLSLCFSLRHCACHCVSLCRTVPPSLCFSLPHCASFTVSLTVSLSFTVSFPLWASHYVSLTHCVFQVCRTADGS